MPLLKRRAYIDFLLNREHPPRVLVDLTDEQPPSDPLSPAERAAKHRARSDYKAKLEALPVDELRELARIACGGADPEATITSLTHPKTMEAAIDWKQKCKELIVEYNEEYAKLRQELRSLQAGKAAADARIAELESKIGQLERLASQVRPSTGPENPSLVAQRENILKIVYVMARSKGYGYVPDKRNDAVTKIKNALIADDLDLSDDTIRRVLKAAAEFVQKLKIEQKQ